MTIELLNGRKQDMGYKLNDPTIIANVFFVAAK